MKEPRSILITGASSGIGEALAVEYARAGICLALSGRNAQRLHDVATRCRDLGARVHSRSVDVVERQAMEDWIAHADEADPLDLVIANAGISGGETQEHARAIFAVNLDGVLNTIWPAIERMRSRGHGQIAITSSIAALVPLPSAPAYSASKAAVKAYAEALHGWLKPYGVCVTAICPGFVESRLTAKNNFPMPFFMDAPKAARIIRKGLTKRPVNLIFPKRLAFVVSMIGLLPSRLRVWILARAPQKS